jgi:hypothetical protein
MPFAVTFDAFPAPDGPLHTLIPGIAKRWLPFIEPLRGATSSRPSTCRRCWNRWTPDRNGQCWY